APAARPASASARSGTIACASPPAVAESSRTASRYESVATSVMPSRFTSASTPVSVGRASSFDAALPTWPTATANEGASTVTRIQALHVDPRQGRDPRPVRHAPLDGLQGLRQVISVAPQLHLFTSCTDALVLTFPNP